mmetsp:Transcript_13475/g.56581  ORF Transcript_13475/g.56581 Transcript_13475/m.56581 type:complete len:359 (-) Transcript_13475:360-1436(-)
MTLSPALTPDEVDAPHVASIVEQYHGAWRDRAHVPNSARAFTEAELPRLRAQVFAPRADDDDDDETLGDIAFHIEQRRLAALAKRRSASAAAGAEKRESAMDPDPSARVVSKSPSKSPVSPALERQVMAFFKRRSDEIEAAKTTSTRSAETEPSAPTAISTRTKESPLAYDETPPEGAPPASVDAKVQTKPPFFERTGVASEDGSREEYHRAPPGYFESTGSRRLVLATSLRGDGGDDDGSGGGRGGVRRSRRASCFPGRGAGEAACYPRDRVRLALDQQSTGRVPRDHGPRARRRRRALRRERRARREGGDEKKRIRAFRLGRLTDRAGLCELLRHGELRMRRGGGVAGGPGPRPAF